MTPGSYLCLRREAAGASIDTLAGMVRTEPHNMPEHDRRAWLARVESDDVPITADVLSAYRAVCEFDDDVLGELILIHSGLAPIGAGVQLCRVCGCSEDDPCIGESGETCAWHEADLCTSCAPADVLDLTSDQQLPPAAGAAA